jgi:hypothetical protein
MKSLADLAKVIRSKNAGPFYITFDIMFDSEEDYNLVKHQEILTTEIANLIFSTDFAQVINYDPALSIKVNIPRKHSSGEFLDADLYGAQLHIPLLNLIIQE